MTKARILIVEDDPFISTFLASKCKEQYDTVVAADNDAARKVLQAQPIDLIVLDILLPKEDGFVLLKEIKEEGSPYEHIPVLILSNFDRPEDVQRGLKLGAVEFMIKGNYVPAEIVQHISKILRKQAAS